MTTFLRSYSDTYHVLREGEGASFCGRARVSQLGESRKTDSISETDHICASCLRSTRANNVVIHRTPPSTLDSLSAEQMRTALERIKSRLDRDGDVVDAEWEELVFEGEFVPARVVLHLNVDDFRREVFKRGESKVREEAQEVLNDALRHYRDDGNQVCWLDPDKPIGIEVYEVEMEEA